MSIETSSGNYTLPSKERMKLKQIYKNLACSICQDKMNQNADIVCGDPWGLHIDEIEQGYSCVLARTKKGYDLLVKAQEEGYIYLEPCDADDITRGQNVTDEYFIEKEKIRRFFQANNWIYPYIFSSKCTNVDNETLKRFEIKQLEYEKKLYDCDDMKKIARLIRIKKVIYQIEIVKILYKVIKSKLVNRIKLEKKAYKH